MIVDQVKDEIWTQKTAKSIIHQPQPDSGPGTQWGTDGN